MRFLTTLFFTIFFTTSFTGIIAQDQSFEASVPSNWSSQNGFLSISSDHYKLDNKSLQWDWTANAEITVTDLQNNGLQPSQVLGYSQNMFRMWVYNTTAISSAPLLVEFYDANGQLQYHYEFQLDFTGWRAASTSYKHEMSGNKTSDDITTMKIKAPTSGQGTFYFDYIDYTMARNTMRSADYQLPFITKNKNEHWGDVMYFKTLAPSLPYPSPTSQELIDLALVKQAYDAYILGNAQSTTAVSNATSKYNALNISYTNGNVIGTPLYGQDYSSSQNIKAVEDFLLVFARDAKHSNTSSSETYFLNTVRYLLDQGFADGSAMETVHHIGYNFRNIPAAIHLMKDTLLNAGLWEQAQKMVAWYTAVDGIWEPTASLSNMDDANTRTIYRLGACLYKSTDAEKVRYLKGFQNYIKNFLTLYPRQGEGMKIDFTGFHHNTYYPGYTFLGYNGLAKAIRFLSGSSFEVDADAKSVLKKSLLLARVVTSSGDIPNSLSGRNPFLKPSIKNGLKDLGLATPNDNTLLKAYNYQFGSDTQTTSFGEETAPNGFWQVNFSNLGVYRQNDWIAAIKGFNNYFWGTEIYTTANRYGRYQSYGAIEVMYQGGAVQSKFKKEGWDWRKVPGTTAKYLSFEDLKASNSRQDERTDSKLAASLRFETKTQAYIDDTVEGNYGVFAMDFIQKGITSTHDVNFSFKKSVFCIDGKLICLGSDIYSESGQIATNLFQNYLSDTSQAVAVNNSSIQTFPYNTTLDNGSSNWLLDANQTGYYIANGAAVVLDRKNQQSPSHKGDGTFTYGDFASAYINHGTSPDGADYEYVIIPGTTSQQMDSFSTNMQGESAPFYSVLTKNEKAHIIYSQGIYGHAFFQNATHDLDSPIVKNEGASLVMLEQSQCSLDLSVVQPDLNFAADNGNSQEKTVKLTVKGKWSLDSSQGGTVTVQETILGTEITIAAKNGTPVDITLNKCFVNPDYPVVYYEDFRYEGTSNGFTRHVADNGGFTILDAEGDAISHTNIVKRLSDIPDADDTDNQFDVNEERKTYRISQGVNDGQSRNQRAISTYGHNNQINYAVDAYAVFTTVDLTDVNPRINPTDSRKFASFWSKRRYGDGDIATVTLLVSTEYTGDPTTTNWSVLPMHSGKLATTSDNLKYVNGVVDLTSFANSDKGNQVTLALRYQGSDTPYVSQVNRNGEFRFSDLKFFVSSELLSDTNTYPSEDNIVVFPNPVHRSLNILSMDPALEIENIRLLNVYGTTVYSASNETVVDVQNFVPGLYVLIIETNTELVITKKIIVN